jgi:uncharacterized protein (TIGR03032 family)
MTNRSQPEADQKSASSVLISFCNQGASPEYSLCLLNISDRSVTWIPLSELYSQIHSGLGGVCGVSWSNEKIIIATQGPNPLLACWDCKSKCWVSTIQLQKVVDAHSIVVRNEYVYVVSTGTNEIYRVSWNGSDFRDEEIYWQYPGVSYDHDVVHLNGLALDGDSLIASGFGVRDGDGRWAAKGEVFYVDKKQSLIFCGLDQPHSPTMIEGNLYIAESKAGLIHKFQRENDKWAVKKTYSVGGYVRGIAILNYKLIAGISAPRSVSRSGKNRVETDGADKSNFGLVTIDIPSGQVIHDDFTSSLGKEIYDLLIISCCHTGASRENALAVRISNMETIFQEISLEYHAHAMEYAKLIKEYNILKNKEERKLYYRIRKFFGKVGSLYRKVID